MRILLITTTLALLVMSAGCAKRVLLAPHAMPTDTRDGFKPPPTSGDYVYFVEQEEEKDSRIKKCDIRPDNTVACTTQYDMD